VLGTVFAAARPLENAAVEQRWQAEPGLRVLRVDDVNRLQPKRPDAIRAPFRRSNLGREIERCNQPLQHLLARFVNDAERIDVTGMDAGQAGDMAQIVEAAHCRAFAGDTRKNAALISGRLPHGGDSVVAYKRRPAGEISAATGSLPKLTKAANVEPSPSTHSA